MSTMFSCSSGIAWAAGAEFFLGVRAMGCSEVLVDRRSVASLPRERVSARGGNCLL
ncbi:hypothetical protein ACFFX0_05830 [Citricoccus parietis]|uniref:Uncharacterized protein n=1 Tax=Citricoccus parietis TaxID=592307 RepID=A0ABV5FVP0_9MICC